MTLSGKFGEFATKLRSTAGEEFSGAPGVADGQIILDQPLDILRQHLQHRPRHAPELAQLVLVHDPDLRKQRLKVRRRRVGKADGVALHRRGAAVVEGLFGGIDALEGGADEASGFRAGAAAEAVLDGGDFAVVAVERLAVEACLGRFLRPGGEAAVGGQAAVPEGAGRIGGGGQSPFGDCLRRGRCKSGDRQGGGLGGCGGWW